MPHVILCTVLLVDRRREVVDKQRPMLAGECWMWLEREVGWPHVVLGYFGGAVSGVPGALFAGLDHSNSSASATLT